MWCYLGMNITILQFLYKLFFISHHNIWKKSGCYTFGERRLICLANEVCLRTNKHNTNFLTLCREMKTNKSTASSGLEQVHSRDLVNNNQPLSCSQALSSSFPFLRLLRAARLVVVRSDKANS